jgi:hypothetical protein
MSDYNIYKESSNTIFSAYSKSHFASIIFKPFKQFGKRYMFQGGETSQSSDKFYMNLKEDSFAALLHYTSLLIKNVNLSGFHQISFSQINNVYKKITLSANNNNNPNQVEKASFYLNFSKGQNNNGIPLSYFNLIELNKLAKNVLENRYETNIAYIREIATLSLPKNEGKDIYDALKSLSNNYNSSNNNYNNQQSNQQNNVIQPNNYNSQPQNNYNSQPNNNQTNYNQQPQQQSNNSATERQIAAIMNLVTKNDKRYPAFENMSMPDIEKTARKMSKSEASDVIGFYKNN